MNQGENAYLDLLVELVEGGSYRQGRNGGTYSLFGRQIRFDLREGFPLLTTKKLFTRAIVGELLWFIRGDTNIKYLNDNGIRIWNEWADENGDLGPVYGKQWRDFNGVDQITNLLEDLKNDPYSRRHIVTAWNPVDVPNMALPPCHCLFQFYVDKGDYLSCQLYQRSADVFLGVPFNIASYALLTHLVAREVGFKVGEFIHTFGDLHLYENHYDQAFTQVQRSIRKAPQLIIDSDASMFDLEIEDIRFDRYDPHPTIKAEVSV